MVIQTDWDNDEAVAYLQRRLDRIDVVQLAKAENCRGSSWQ